MKITCPTKHLKEILALTSKGVKKNSSIPSLECIRVATSEIGIELTATDYEMEIRCAMGCHVDLTGEVILPAKRFMEVIGSFNGAEVGLTVKDQIASLKCGRSTFRLSAYGSEMPVLPATDEAIGLILPQSLLRDMFEKVECAMGNDANRPILNGARFILAEGQVEMAASDTHVLAVYPLQLDGDDLPAFDCTIPRRTVTEIQNFLSKDEDEDVEIVVDQSQIEFRTPFYTIKSRLLQGRAIDYRRVVPRDPEAHFVLDRISFLETVKRLDVLAKEEVHRFRLQLGDQDARFEVTAAGIGDADESISCQGEKIDKFYEIWLHTKQVASILDSFQGNKVNLHYTAANKPLIFSPEAGAHYALVMPMVAPGVPG